MQTKASAKFVKMSPKKVRLVSDLIRGLDVDTALTQLQFNKRDAALPLLKLLNSAISNAEENSHLKRSNLYIKEIMVNGGPTLHRFMPRAMGRATPIRKRTSHIHLLLDERIASAGKSAAKKQTKTDDLVKVKDFDELKEVTSGTKAEKAEELKNKSQAKGSKKAFTNKIFNRKSG